MSNTEYWVDKLNKECECENDEYRDEWYESRLENIDNLLDIKSYTCEYKYKSSILCDSCKRNLETYIIERDGISNIYEKVNHIEKSLEKIKKFLKEKYVDF